MLWYHCTKEHFKVFCQEGALTRDVGSFSWVLQSRGSPSNPSHGADYDRNHTSAFITLVILWADFFLEGKGKICFGLGGSRERGEVKINVIIIILKSFSSLNFTKQQL